MSNYICISEKISKVGTYNFQISISLLSSVTRRDGDSGIGMDEKSTRKNGAPSITTFFG